MNKTGWLTQQSEMMIPTKDTKEPENKEQTLNMTYSMDKLLQETRDLRRKLNERDIQTQINCNDTLNSRN